MDPFGVVVLCLVAAIVLTSGLGKKKGKLFAALLTPGKKGAMGLTLWPAKRTRRRRRKR